MEPDPRPIPGNAPRETAAGRARRRATAAAIALVPFVALALGADLPERMRALAVERPAHPHGKFRGECGLCHGAEGWKPAVISKQFDHSKFGFRLAGAHAAAPCASCHVTLDFSTTASRCASCHEDPHLGELGLDCARCHGDRSFLDRARMRRAHQFTTFPLSGAHAMIDCAECHPPTAQGQPRFVAARAECVTCHRADFLATTDPAHGPAGFPVDCAACHTSRSWRGARFDHAGTRFPLTGAHRALPCAACHGDGVWRGKDPSCVSCHRPEYDATTDPQHASLGFPLACESCHGTSTWSGGRFDHDAMFPIDSGPHAGRWASCATCHTNPANYSVFTCLSCHPHADRAGTDDHHSEVAGYAYDSQACFNCHPRGRH